MKEGKNKMLGQQIKAEFKKAVTGRQLIIWSALVLVFPTIQFLLVMNNYVYYRQLEIFLRVNNGFLPILLPFLMVLVYAVRFIGEQKNNFIPYARIRISLKDYIGSKAIVNALFSFSAAFLMVFIPFLFIIYIEPSLGIIELYPPGSSPKVVTTFEQLLPYGTLTYGLIYSIWVGLNGMLYATIAFLLLQLLNNSFVALSIPFAGYMVIVFILQVFHLDKFSPMDSGFPFGIGQQPLWTVFIPFSAICLVITVLILNVRKKLYSRYE